MIGVGHRLGCGLDLAGLLQGVRIKDTHALSPLAACIQPCVAAVH